MLHSSDPLQLHHCSQERRLTQLPSQSNGMPVCSRGAHTGTWLSCQRLCVLMFVNCLNKRSGPCGAGLSYGSAAAEAGHSSSRADEEVAVRLLALVTHEALPAAGRDVQLVVCVSLEEASRSF